MLLCEIGSEPVDDIPHTRRLEAGATGSDVDCGGTLSPDTQIM